MKFSSASRNELLTGLSKLKLLENFKSFTVEVTIAAGEEAKIRNELDPKIPSFRLIVRETGDNGKILDGDTTWSSDFVYIKNAGSGSVTATILFME